MLAIILLCFAVLSFGQEEGEAGRPAASPQQTPSPQATASPAVPASTQQRGSQERPATPAEELPVVTHHEIRAGGKTLRYTATVGMMPLKNREGEIEARIFFMAYTLNDPDSRTRRPLTFSFNGGAPSASAWLDLVFVVPKQLPLNRSGP